MMTSCNRQIVGVRQIKSQAGFLLVFGGMLPSIEWFLSSYWSIAAIFVYIFLVDGLGIL
ncbi:hypothetical protein [Kerstersia gyiorum]|uniref:hypothetical protein n=1 Tax=Kerstersia gyiorum TaxID=206506 RepID=UPI00142F3D09|nr:hypothetical protein [Kerstersia gyiorum]MCR4157476.1 hypothetical protein [Kerstersia gyiorum]